MSRTPLFAWLTLLLTTTAAGCADPVVAREYLVVVNISPPGGSAGIQVDTEVSATFNAELDSSTVQGENLWLEDEDGVLVSAGIEYDETTWSIFLLPEEDLATDTTYTFHLTSDITSPSLGDLAADVESSFQTTATLPQDELPVADAGEDQEVEVETNVYLDGTGSYDPEGASLTYDWAFEDVPEESDASLENTDTPSASFYADVAGTWVVSLVVDDGVNLSDPDYVTIVAE